MRPPGWPARRWKAGGPPSGGIPALRSPVPACHYLVDHQMGVIFIRTTKIGGTSITDLLGVHNHPVACRWVCRRPAELGGIACHPAELPLAHWVMLCMTRMVCMMCASRRRRDPNKCSHGCQDKPLCLKYMTHPEVVERVWQNYTGGATTRQAGRRSWLAGRRAGGLYF